MRAWDGKRAIRDRALRNLSLGWDVRMGRKYGV
jgi:hypothetical protein